MERKCPGNAQYSRQEYLDIMSIPRSGGESFKNLLRPAIVSLE